MACGLALKRPLELDPLFISGSPEPSKRQRSNNYSYTPAAQSTTSKSSPFSSISTNLSKEQLESFLRAEIKSLRRRRVLPAKYSYSRSTANSSGVDEKNGGNGKRKGEEEKAETENNSHSKIAKYRNNSANHHGDQSSDSEGEQQQSSLLQQSSDDPNNLRAGGSAIDDEYGYNKTKEGTKRQFTFEQVQVICQRLLREQEDRLRAQYEAVLQEKMAEQYESFCRFTQDQIYRQQNAADSVPSYLS